MKLAKSEDVLTDYSLVLILEEAVQTYHPEYLTNLFTVFPQLSHLPTESIFMAIIIRNLQVLKVIVNNRIQDDLFNINSDGLTPFDLAARKDFWQAIHIMARAFKKLLINIYTNAMRTSIMSNSLRTFTSLMTEINGIGPFNVAVSKMTIISFFINALDIGNLEIVKLLLFNSPSDILSCVELEGPFGQFNDAKSTYFNPIFHAIKQDYLDGFLAFINYYGMEILNFRDNYSRTPLLMASICGNANIVRIIAALDSKLILHTDLRGNNALHIAIKNLDDPISFIKEVLFLDFDWDQENDLGESAVDILSELPNISLENLSVVYNKYIQK